MGESGERSVIMVGKEFVTDEAGMESREEGTERSSTEQVE